VKRNLGSKLSLSRSLSLSRFLARSGTLKHSGTFLEQGLENSVGLFLNRIDCADVTLCFRDPPRGRTPHPTSANTEPGFAGAQRKKKNTRQCTWS